MTLLRSATSDVDTSSSPKRTRVRARLDEPVVRNGITLAAATVVSGVFGYAAWVLAARSLRPSDVGVSASIIGAFTLAALVANLGLAPAVIQTLPSRRGREWTTTVIEALAVAAASGALAGGIVAMWLLATADDVRIGSQPGLIAVLVVGAALTNVSVVVDGVLVSARAPRRVVVRLGGFALIRLGLLVVALLAGADGAGLVALTWVGATAASVLLGIAVLIPGAHRQAQPGLRSPVSGEAAEPSRVLRFLDPTLRRRALGNWAVSLGAEFPSKAIPLVVVVFLGSTATAAATLAWMLASMLSALSPGVSAALLSEGSHGSALDPLVRKARRFLLLVLMPAVAVVVLARGLLLDVFGPDYAVASSTLALFVVAVIPDAVGNVAIAGLRVREHYGIAALINGTTAVICLVGAALLLTDHGIVAVGWTWLVAQCFCAIASTMMLRATERREVHVDHRTTA